MEIDRERSAVLKAQKELAEAAKRADKREAEHRRAVGALQEQQSDARHQNGVLQGKLAALEAAHQALQEQERLWRGAPRPTTRPATSVKSDAPVKRRAGKAAASKPIRAKSRGSVR